MGFYDWRLKISLAAHEPGGQMATPPTHRNRQRQRSLRQWFSALSGVLAGFGWLA